MITDQSLGRGAESFGMIMGSSTEHRIMGKQCPRNSRSSVSLQHQPSGRTIVFRYIGYNLNVELKNTLFSGMALMIPLCWAMLFISTRNIINATLAISTVCCVVVCVMGSFKLFGWQLGLLESIAGIIVIGLAMDYSLHFMHVGGTFSVGLFTTTTTGPQVGTRLVGHGDVLLWRSEQRPTSRTSLIMFEYQSESFEERFSCMRI